MFDNNTKDNGTDCSRKFPSGGLMDPPEIISTTRLEDDLVVEETKGVDPPPSLSFCHENDNGDDDHNRNHGILAEFICPITHDLPFDPVTAQDGHVYERSAILAYIRQYHQKQKQQPTKHQGHTPLLSPFTRQPMGTQLLPARQTKNQIQALLKSGVIADAAVIAEWNAKVTQQETNQAWLHKAQQGDARAMRHVGWAYLTGKLWGFAMDKQAAYTWLRRAHRAGDVMGTAYLGECYLYGWGMAAANTTQAMTLFGIAAGQGSDLAAYKLGMAWATGAFHLPVDTEEAIYWLQKCLDAAQCPYKNLVHSARQKAAAKLKQLLGTAAETTASSSATAHH